MVSNVLLNGYKTQEISTEEWEKLKNPSKSWLEKRLGFATLNYPNFSAARAKDSPKNWACSTPTWADTC